MVRVAIAGYGAVGRTLIEFLKNDPNHIIFVISRKVPEGAHDPKALPITTDYQDVESIKSMLESNKIHTVISCLSVSDESAGSAQVNLVKAAAKSTSAMRFVHSNWSIPYPEDTADWMPELRFRFAAVEELKKTNLEWTQVYNGFFLDYYGMPYVETFQKPLSLGLDVANKIAGIPGTGNEPITFTYTFDVAKFVQGLLEAEKWPRDSFIIGDKVTWNEFVQLAEEAREGCKFEVHYDDLEKLKKFQITELPAQVAHYSLVPKEHFQYVFANLGRWMATGSYNLPHDGSLNEKFPHIKTLSVKAMLQQIWKGR
ncbi:hypothetical protein SLS56_003242 [Neofusicoccum ribis]|uniref:NmrA-like domain-containing protein n=1 Tax=Neofusicoccum ribis TaxID=45134 RepID=A0ABR3T1J7_9PEZI